HVRHGRGEHGAGSELSDEGRGGLSGRAHRTATDVDRAEPLALASEIDRLDPVATAVATGRIDEGIVPTSERIEPGPEHGARDQTAHLRPLSVLFPVDPVTEVPDLGSGFPADASRLAVTDRVGADHLDGRRSRADLQHDRRPTREIVEREPGREAPDLR